ncbi:DUF1467 family protein [Rickettsiales bacterium]|nr:DUF1467 family protein [Rickettsiales bacterium]
MNIVSISIVFCVVWWLAFFIILPIGLKKDDNPQKGNDSGAPENANIAIKMIASTFVSIIFCAIFYYLMEIDFFAFLDIRGLK